MRSMSPGQVLEAPYRMIAKRSKKRKKLRSKEKQERGVSEQHSDKSRERDNARRRHLKQVRSRIHVSSAAGVSEGWPRREKRHISAALAKLRCTPTGCRPERPTFSAAAGWRETLTCACCTPDACTCKHLWSAVRVTVVCVLIPVVLIISL